MIVVRAPHAATCSCACSARLVRTERSGALQKQRDYLTVADCDVLFECWGATDRLSLHALAAECEWALAMLWDRETVYTRAVTELSPRALQRIARSLCTGMINDMRYGAEACFMSKYALANAQTMAQWRMRDER